MLAVNPSEPRAWAYRAVLAHCETTRRGKGGPRRRRWRTGSRIPEVDHTHRPQAVAEVPVRRGGRLPAARRWRSTRRTCPPRSSSRQDLLRLGEEEEGWKLADEIFASRRLQRRRLQPDDPPRPSGQVPHARRTTASSCGWTRARRTLYGRRVLALLKRAKATLCAKYGVTIAGPGDRRDLPAEEGVRRPDVRPARGRGSARRLLRPRDHGEQPGVAGGAPVELGGRALARVLPCRSR